MIKDAQDLADYIVKLGYDNVDFWVEQILGVENLEFPMKESSVVEWLDYFSFTMARSKVIKDSIELKNYFIEWDCPPEEAMELAQEAEISYPILKSEVDDYLIDCGLLVPIEYGWNYDCKELQQGV